MRCFCHRMSDCPQKTKCYVNRTKQIMPNITGNQPIMILNGINYGLIFNFLFCSYTEIKYRTNN